MPAPTLVSLVGSLGTAPGGERYIQLSEIVPGGSVSMRPLGVNSRDLRSRLLDGLYVSAWGIVKPGSVTANSYIIADDPDEAGIRVVTQGAPTVAENQFVSVTGAAGYDDGRLLIAE